MYKKKHRFIYWAPRIISILFALFLGLFALDVFEDGVSWAAIGGFLVHLAPTYIIVLVLILSWKWEWIGGILYLALGIFYIIWAWGKFDIWAYVGISGPAFLIGILFLLGWYYRVRAGRKEEIEDPV